MLQAFKSAKWRQAIGLIAAYALALNVILTAFGTQAVAANHAGPVDPFSIICLSGAGDQATGLDTGSGSQAPVQHSGHHCTLCGCAASAVPPLPVFLHLQRAPSSAPASAVAHGPVADIKALPGQPRAPPHA